jgi:AcrR family transcriptional regulator
MVNVSDPAQPRRQRGRRSAPRTDRPELRETILDAMAQLLERGSFAEMTVADILAAAGVSRGSFYFYFDSKHDVLAELVRRAVAHGHDAAEPWLAGPPDVTSALRSGISAGARLWQANAPVLRAIVDNWRTDPRLAQLWLDQMQSFTDAAAERIAADPRASSRLAHLDITAVASSLTWLGERLYYLAAIDVAPFNDEGILIDTLLHIWISTLYGDIT